MASCKECVHYEVCMDYTFLEASEFAQNFDKQSDLCEYWEPKIIIKTAFWDWQVDGTHFCSNCGNDAPLRYVDEYCSFYCPHCGRRMTHVETPNDTGIGEYDCDE